MTEADRQRKLLNAVVWDELWRICWRQAPKVQLFGSQKYGLATDNSDFDFSLELPEECLKLAKVLRAAVRQRLIEDQVTTRAKSSDQLANATLKWTDIKEKVKVSLKVSPTSGFDSALAVTEYLREFYRAHEDMKEPVMAVAQRLRNKKLMGGASVDDGLKSAPRGS